MSNYGRNFEITVFPHAQDRKGRFFLDVAVDTTPIGVGVAYSTGGTVGAANDLDLQPVEPVDGDVAPTEMSGIAIYEYAPNAFAGDDPVLTDYSDKDTIPAGAAVQVVSGPYVKVRFKNTTAETFLQSRNYAGRLMVAPAGLAGVDVGDFLQPQATPSDANGHWAVAVTPANAWLVVTSVDTARGEVEAQMVF